MVGDSVPAFQDKLGANDLNRADVSSGIVSSGNAWERRSQSYFDSGNGIPRNAIIR